MKSFTILPVIVYILFSTAAFSQDTTYLARYDVKVKTLDSAKFIEISYHTAEKKKLIKKFTKDFHLLSEYNYINVKDTVYQPHDLCREWYEGGQLKFEIEYKEGTFHGYCKSYWKNGTPKRNDIYKDDKLENGNCYDSTGKEIKWFPYYQYPEYPGGVVKLNKFLSKTIKYPKAAIKRGEQGTVFVSFVVDTDGRPTNVRVSKGVSPLLDEEAVKVVGQMPKWKQGYMDGELVSVKYMVPIKFRL